MRKNKSIATKSSMDKFQKVMDIHLAEYYRDTLKIAVDKALSRTSDKTVEKALNEILGEAEEKYKILSKLV